VAREYRAAARCFVVECDFDKASHNNRFRQIIGPDEKHKNVGDLTIRMFFKAFQVGNLYRA
jgi:hypothetical protein